MFVDFFDKKINVEVFGEGEPIVILNGIMMSTLSWGNFIKPLSKNNKIILLDFLDQGKSSKMEENFNIELQADVVSEVLKSLKIESVNVAGISYGGSVALQFAVKYPERLKKLVIFNGVAYTSNWLRDIGESWKKSRVSPEAYYYTTIPVIYSMDFYNKNIEWIENRKAFLIKNIFNNNDFLDSMDRLTESSNFHDVRDRISKIGAPTLVISGRDDILTPISEQKYICENIPNANHIIIENCGHATMYEKPENFISLLLGFINSDFDFKVL